MAEGNAKKNYLGQAWLVLTVALCFGAALAGVQVAWGPRIEANKESEARGQVPRLVPGAQADLSGEGRDIEVADDGGSRTYRVYRAVRRTDAGAVEQIGWVVKAKGSGYADTIELLIGLDAGAGKITGLYVLAQNETPGLGNKISGAAWRRQFAGKATDEPLAVTKAKPAADNDIQAISGATVSSRSVCRIVNQAVVDFRGAMATLDEDTE